ncbi:MAG: glycoside hydrolase family 28 protein [Verrucomicrobiota bacterium]
MPELPRIPARAFSVADYGALGDGKTMNTAALQHAIDAVGKSGGGTLHVPVGRFVTGPLVLGSNLNLHLAKGAVILISDDMATYPQTHGRYQDSITSVKSHDLEISGEGCIDGQGASWWAAFEANHDMPHRPYLIKFDHCERVRVAGITLINSPMFHLVPNQCAEVTIRDITISAPSTAHNTDGIDPSGTNFLIDGCHIDTGDDNIAIKPCAPAMNRNFTISNCEFRRGHGMSIGSGTNGGLENMLVRNCSFSGTDAGIRIKTARGRGGLLKNVTYDHLSMTKVKKPIEIVCYYPKTPKTPDEDPRQAITPLTPTFDNITISNVTSTASPGAGVIWGLPEMPVADIHFINVHLTAATGMKMVHAKGIRFTDSALTIAKGKALILSDAEVTGLK